MFGIVDIFEEKKLPEELQYYLLRMMDLIGYFKPVSLIQSLKDAGFTNSEIDIIGECVIKITSNTNSNLKKLLEDSTFKTVTLEQKKKTETWLVNALEKIDNIILWDERKKTALQTFSSTCLTKHQNPSASHYSSIIVLAESNDEVRDNTTFYSSIRHQFKADNCYLLVNKASVDIHDKPLQFANLIMEKAYFTILTYQDENDKKNIFTTLLNKNIQQKLDHEENINRAPLLAACATEKFGILMITNANHFYSNQILLHELFGKQCEIITSSSDDLSWQTILLHIKNCFKSSFNTSKSEEIKTMPSHGTNSNDSFIKINPLNQTIGKTSDNSFNSLQKEVAIKTKEDANFPEEVSHLFFDNDEIPNATHENNKSSTALKFLTGAGLGVLAFAFFTASKERKAEAISSIIEFLKPN